MPLDPNDDAVDLSTLDRGDSVPGDDTAPAPSGDDTVAAPQGDDTVAAPAGDDTVAAPAGDDTVAAPPADDKVQTTKRDHMIPKSRLDEEIRKRRDLEARLKALEDAAKPPAKDEPKPDPATVVGTEEWFDAQEDAYMEAVLEGKNADAKAIRKQIRTAELAKADEIAAKRSDHAVSRIDLQKELDSAITSLEDAFPALNANDPEYDSVITQAVLSAQATMLRQDETMTPGRAMIEAAKKLGFKLAEVDDASDAADEVPPAAPAKPAPAKPAQPPRAAPGGAPAGGDKAPLRLTEASVAKMSEVEKARARGDIF